jgi:hypothetical protein
MVRETIANGGLEQRAKLFDVFLLALEDERFFDRERRETANTEIVAGIREQMRGRKAGNVLKSCSGKVGARLLQQKICNEVAIEFGGNFGGEADGIEGVAEDELA